MPIISEAGTVITAPGVYTLDRDLFHGAGAGAAITIGADNVVIDLNGHRISGSGLAGSFASGIEATNRSNITIRNGTIDGFFYGVELTDTTANTVRYGDHLVSNLFVSNCTFRGIVVMGPDNVVQGCRINDIQGTTVYANAFAAGIESFGPRARLVNNTITEIYARDLGEGLGISVSNNGVGTIVSGNTIRNSAFDEFRSFGIWVGGGSDVTSYRNTVTNYTYEHGWSSSTKGAFYSNTAINVPKWIINSAGLAVVDKGGNTIHGTAGADSYTGYAGANFMYGRGGNDTLNGMGGADRLWGGVGADRLIGGDGYDQARYDEAAYASFRVSLENAGLNTGAARGDTFQGIEALVLSRGHDTAYGDTGHNTIEGQAGNDNLFGRDGADRLYGGAGNDHLYGGRSGDLHDGGTGFDYARFDDAAYPPLVISLLTPSRNTGVAVGDRYVAVEGVIASSGDDVVYGNTVANWLYGRGGSDTLYGHLGQDHLIGEAGADRFMFDTRPSAANMDVIEGFVSGQDSLGLARSIFGGADDGAGGVRFVAGPGAHATTSAATLVYDSTTKILSYDSNGSAAGGTQPIARLGTVAASDFFFV
jgi:Ca2+-binding RTX toxin-like protein